MPLIQTQYSPKEEEGTICLSLLCFRKSLECIFFVFHWSAFAHYGKLLNPSLVLRNEVIMIDLERVHGYVEGRYLKKSASFREEWVLGGEYNH